MCESMPTPCVSSSYTCRHAARGKKPVSPTSPVSFSSPRLSSDQVTNFQATNPVSAPPLAATYSDLTKQKQRVSPGLQAGRAISCLPLVTVSSFSCRASAITGGGAELSRSALVSLRSAFAESFVHTFSPSFRKQVAAHHEGGAAEAPRHRDRKVAIVLVGRECISEVHRSMNITHPPQRL